MECQYCKNIFTTKTSLNTHQKTTKYCLILRGNEIPSTYTCTGCSKNFARKYEYHRHLSVCNADTVVSEYKLQLFDLQTKNNNQQSYICNLEKTIQEQKQTIKDLQDKLENIALKAVSQNFEDEAVIEIEPEMDSDDENSEQEYQLTSLDLGKGCQIEHREKDGYINVTNLCKAGGKQFKAWNRLEKTKAFLHVLSSSVLISTDLLIKIKID